MSERTTEKITTLLHDAILAMVKQGRICRERRPDLDQANANRNPDIEAPAGCCMYFDPENNDRCLIGHMLSQDLVQKIDNGCVADIMVGGYGHRVAAELGLSNDLKDTDEGLFFEDRFHLDLVQNAHDDSWTVEQMFKRLVGLGQDYWWIKAAIPTFEEVQLATPHPVDSERG